MQVVNPEVRDGGVAHITLLKIKILIRVFIFCFYPFLNEIILKVEGIIHN